MIEPCRNNNVNRELPLNGPQLAACPGGSLTAIQDTKYGRTPSSVHFIVHGVRKSPGQQTMVSHHLRVNATIESQRINVRENGIKEVIAKSLALGFVEHTASRQIVESGREYPHLHLNLLRRDCFAVSQSSTCSWPSASRRSVAANSSACQAGDTNSSSGRLNSSQSVSISFNFSLRGSWRKLSTVIPEE